MISVIIPFYNEKQNLLILQESLKHELGRLNQHYEIVFVDDGSTDGSKENIEKENKSVKLISHRKRMGKGKALNSGFKSSKGDIIFFMDADMQDDPKEIPVFLEKLSEGHDFVIGWRKERRDPISKTLPSSLFNFFLLKLLLKSKFHDINCGFKLMKRQVLESIPLYGDNYRFLPILALKEGFKATEIKVTHNPRKYGKSKYGFFRIFTGFIDTLSTYFVYRFSEKPLHFFGPVGALIFFAGFVITLYLGIGRLFFGILLYNRPILQLGILLIIVGLQVIMTGFLGDLIVYLSKKSKS